MNLKKLTALPIAAILASMLAIPATGVSADVNPVTPSTNDINRTNGWAHVDQVSQGIGTTTLQFISLRSFASCFEYRTDGDITQKTSDTNYNPAITDGLYPFYCQNNNSRTSTFTALEYVEVRMVFGAEKDERFDWTRFDVLPLPVTSFDPTTAAFCKSDSTTLNINLAGAVDLYGYQFKVLYDQTKVSAVGAFVDDWFDTTTNASPVPGWKGNCAAGVCQFAVSKMAPATPLTGSDIVAKVTFTGVALGTSNVSVADVILSDIDGNATSADLGTSTLNVNCAYAKVSGIVSMQGRSQPGPELALPSMPLIDTGKVTLTDGAFGPYTGDINQTTGAFTINNIKVMDGGTNYSFAASHWLYLTNQKDVTLNPDDNLTGQNTRLLGGDATDDKMITVGDLSCIGGQFSTLTPAACGTGWPDINNDGTVNIQDLSIAGGNYDKTTTQPW